MRSEISKAVGAFVALVLAGNVLRTKLRSRSHLPLPPGPPGHWLFGNLLPSANQSQQFAEWINTYGPIISLQIGPGRVMVIIGRHQEANDIMEKEGGVLADRPRAVAAEIVSRGLYMILVRPGEQFRRLRKAAHTYLQAKAADSYAPIQMDAARDVILDILDNPKGHQAAVNRYSVSVILRVMYGKSTPTTMNAPEIIVIHKMLKRAEMLFRPGAFLIERYPILKYVPGYTSELEEWGREESQVFHDQLNRVSRELASGKAGPSFSRYLLENQSSHKLSDDEMAYLAGLLFGAGAETTAVAIMYVVMASTCYPKAQEKVQEQLDIVVGRDRAPTFDDYNSLPQVEAFMLECLRWRPVTPLGFAHHASADIVYVHFQAISRDPSVYPNPDKFDPERWLNSDGTIRDDLTFPSFGFGRRICPGQHITNHSVFINIALLLWSFKITQDPENPIDEMDIMDGVVAHPKLFVARFQPWFGDEASLRNVMAEYGQGL
ncbi:cytochrome P450 [Suillus subluteus]|nr:cytochrome P450 [Suillus subluteus]